LVRYSGTVRNSGDITLNNIVVVSDQPAPNTRVFTALILAPGASSDFTGTFTVPSTNVCAVTTTLNASATSSCGTEPITDSATVSCPISTNPGIAVTLACPAPPLAPGGPVTYTGTVSNTGDIALHDVTVTSTAPPPEKVVFSVLTLGAKASATFTYTVTTAADTCSIASTVTATGTGLCSETSVSNSATATCPLVGAPKIDVILNCPTTPAGTDGTLAITGSVQNTGNMTLTNVVVVGQFGATGPGPQPQPTDTIWVEDSLPRGALPAPFAAVVDPWTWVTSNPTPFSGTQAHQSRTRAGFHQHFFYNALEALNVGAGDILFTYIYLDPANLPRQIMLQWDDGSWEHRAYWGANSVGFGTDNTVSRRNMGGLPAAGQWVKLEVPASSVGLEGKIVRGMAFTLFGGHAYWDSAGRSAAQ